MQKIGFSLQTSYSWPIPDVLSFLADLGVSAVPPIWQRTSSTEELVDQALRCGLSIQSLHGPFRGIPDLWRSAFLQSPAILQDLLCAVDDCSAFGIPVLVVHSWGGLDYTFRKDMLYFDHFDLLIEHAQRKGVQIAFENLEGWEFLAALMERYADVSAVGFCWDSGHELCYSPDQDFLSLYGDRLLMTHLNDNLGITDPCGRLQGTDDLHLLPYDGMTDWPNTMARLRQVSQQEILNFELKIRPKGDRCKYDLYSGIPLEQYLTTAYERARKAASFYG